MSEPVVPSTEPTTVEPTAPVPVLRREAILPRERRGGLGAVALLCSLAGVASGFALATTILATQLAQSESRMVRRMSIDAPGVIRERAFLGVQYNDVNGGARIVRVFPGTPAAEIGLAVGDVITNYDGEAVDQPSELGYLVRGSAIGHEATLEVRRADTPLIMHPTLMGAMLRDHY